ncbi:hypothetical protein J4526_04760 [Desulfurococcaceae archaeon MEX13E-LK6-19]|nr:hypothetical protein J4526_04760 [Desulfurococcaceae archaeon MEX13E-LK6-19]
MDMLSLLIITVYLGLSLIPIMYNHLRIGSKDLTNKTTKNVAASTPRLQHNIVIVLNNVDEKDLKTILYEIEKLTKRLSHRNNMNQN